MSVLFVADPLESLNVAIDTTVGLMHAASLAGHEVLTTEAGQLEIIDGRPRALVRSVRLASSVPDEGCRWTVPSPWFTAPPASYFWLDEADAIFMRTDPPLTEAYINATFVLDLVDASRTAMINDPRGLRTCSEHMLALQFPDLVPATIATSDSATVREFVARHTTCVLKPIDGFSGRGVLRLHEHDPNLASLIEISTHGGQRMVLVQRYLPEVRDGNKRIFILDGEPQAAVYRYPLEDDFRIGHPAAAAPITSRDRHICQRLAPVLARNGLRMVGLDVIGPHLIEVNVTSPGALRKVDALLGTRLCHDVIDRVLTNRNLRRSA